MVNKYINNFITNNYIITNIANNYISINIYKVYNNINLKIVNSTINIILPAEVFAAFETGLINYYCPGLSIYYAKLCPACPIVPVNKANGTVISPPGQAGSGNLTQMIPAPLVSNTMPAPCAPGPAAQPAVAANVVYLQPIYFSYKGAAPTVVPTTANASATSAPNPLGSFKATNTPIAPGVSRTAPYAIVNSTASGFQAAATGTGAVSGPTAVTTSEAAASSTQAIAVSMTATAAQASMEVQLMPVMGASAVATALPAGSNTTSAPGAGSNTGFETSIIAGSNSGVASPSSGAVSSSGPSSESNVGSGSVASGAGSASSAYSTPAAAGPGSGSDAGSESATAGAISPPISTITPGGASTMSASTLDCAIMAMVALFL